MTRYANTHKGAALFALDSWEFWKEQGVQTSEVEEMIRTGRMYAFAAVLQQITGRLTWSDWRPAIEVMQ